MNENGGNQEDLLGCVFLCRALDLIAATEEAVRHSWSARLDGNCISDLDLGDLHLLVPFARNGNDEDVPESCRCYLWFKHSGIHKRSCVVIDVSVGRLRQLKRPSTPQYDRLVLMLIEELPIRFLTPFTVPTHPRSDLGA